MEISLLHMSKLGDNLHMFAQHVQICFAHCNFKEKHKQKQIQHLATLKDLICSKWLKR